jgi:hypothetical protein
MDIAAPLVHGAAFTLATFALTIGFFVRLLVGTTLAFAAFTLATLALALGFFVGAAFAFTALALATLAFTTFVVGCQRVALGQFGRSKRILAGLGGSHSAHQGQTEGACDFV